MIKEKKGETRCGFYWVYLDIINNNKKQIVRTVINDDVPLRGKLKCFSGKNLTAGNSKGKRSYVWYYLCQDHREFNLNAKKLHLQLEDLLRELSLPDFYIEYLREKIIENTTVKINTRRSS